jgi:O-antigen ligase/tetratricopeptide (TPR) repeat protein
MQESQVNEPNSETEPALFRWGRKILFIHLLLSPLIFGRGIMESFESPKVAVLILTAILLVAGFLTQWLTVRMGKNTDSPSEKQGKKSRKEKTKKVPSVLEIFHWDIHEPITLGILLFFLSALFSTLFSVSFRTSFYGEDDSYAGLITIVSYTILFLGTKALCRSLSACKTLLIAAVIGVAFSVFYGIIQTTGLDPFSWKRISAFGEMMRIFGTMGHPNQLAAFLVMGFPIVCYFSLGLFQKRSFSAGIALIVVELLAAAIIVLSLSRGAWLAMGMMLLVFLIGVAVSVRKKQVILLTLLPWIVGIALGASYFLVGSKGSFVSSPPVASSVNATVSSPTYKAPENILLFRIQQMGISTITQGTRWPIWTAAFAMFIDHPLFGVGLDAFRLAFMQYRPPEYWLREWGGTPTRAHNEPLHILATQGGFGMIAALMITFGLWKTFIRVFRRNGASSEHLLLLISIFSGIIGFYIQNLFNFTVTGTGTLFITFAALLSRLGEKDFDRASVLIPASVPIHKGVQGALFVLAGMAIYLFVFNPMFASYLVARTVFNRSLPAITASANLEEAVLIGPAKDDYFHHLGAAYRKSARETKDPSQRSKFFLLTRDAYQHAIDLVPADSNNHIKLATLLVVMAKESPPLATRDEVYHAVLTALKLDPNNADLYAIGADLAISFGDSGRASLWAKKCSALYPNFAPVRAQLGFVALLDAVRFLKNDLLKEGVKHLDEALKQMELSLPMYWSANYEAKKGATRGDLLKAYLFKAKAKEKLGEMSEAREAYVKLLSIAPDYAEGITAFAAFRKRTEEKQ